MFTSRTSRLKHAISRGATIGIVVVVIIIIAVGGYAVLTLGKTSSTTSTTSTTSGSQVTTTTTTSNSTLSSGPPNKNQFVDEAIGTGAYDSLDPSYGFFTVDGYFTNVFQGLLTNTDNGTAISNTQVSPALASSYSVTGNSPICVAPTALSGGSSNCVGPSINYTQYNFVMRPNTWFSNKDPVNAYVAWFSFVRALYYNAPTTVGISNYALLTVNTTTDEPCFNGTVVPGGCGENIFPAGLENAVNSGFGLNANLGTTLGQNEIVGALNSMLSNFNPATNATQAKVVSYPDQAYVANNATSFTMNLIQPYQLFPLALTAQWAAIEDPIYIDANGGLQNNTGFVGTASQVANFNNNGMPGTGPYMYNCPSQCPADHSQLELVQNPNYWAANVTGLNASLQPAHIPDIIMKFGLQPNTLISDFASNIAQVTSIPFAQLGQAWGSFHANYPQYSFNQVYSNLGYPLCDLAIGINTQGSPSTPNYGETYTNFTLVRQAIVHAVNYSSIQQQLFTYNGTTLGELFLPPVPPGLGPLDNPDNIPLYSYNITLAAQLLNEAGNKYNFYTIPSSPITIGNTSYTQLGNNKTGSLFTDIPFAYIAPLTPELTTEIAIINNGLNQIGLTLSATGITTGIYDTLVTSPATTPQMVGVGWCADWADPIYQQFYDMATTVAHQPSWPNNATLNALLEKIPFETNPSQQLNDTKQAYQIFTQMSTIIQIPNGIDNGGAFMVQPYVHGLLYSFVQFGFYYNTVTYS